MERVVRLDFHVNVASGMWDLEFKELLHISCILMNPILFYFLFSCHIASSCNITSVLL